MTQQRHGLSLKSAAPVGVISNLAARRSRVQQPSDRRIPLRDRVPGMGYDEMLRICQLNGLRFKTRAANQGILTMRARNALYAAFRDNLQLRED